MQIRVFAQSGSMPWQPGRPAVEGAVLFEHAPDRGWVRLTADGAASDAAEIVTAQHETPPVEDAAAIPVATDSAAMADATQDEREFWIEAPDPAATGPVLDWLRELPVAAGAAPPATRPPWPDRDVGWWMRANRRTMQDLGDAWDRRPQNVAYFGTDRMRRLLGAGRAVIPRLRVGGSGVDWLTVSTQWDAEGRALSEADLARLRDATTRFVKLDSGWVRKEEGQEQEAIEAALADLGIDPAGGEQRLSVWQLVGAAPATLLSLEQAGGDAETLAVLGRLREQIAGFTGIPEVPIPDGVVGELRPYQRYGLDFLANSAQLGLGAVLADDMGLGKTVQALVWLLHLYDADPDGGPTLVVCPASVVHNWAREAERFTPRLRVLLLTSGKTRHSLRDEIRTMIWVVTTTRCCAVIWTPGATSPCAPSFSTRRSSSRIPMRPSAAPRASSPPATASP
jgi:hypothetical protein